MKIDRLLSIIILLLNREKITAKELAEYFETTVRTIYRDIDTLTLAGIPVAASQGRGGGYSLMPGFKMDKHIFSSQELLSLVSGLRGVQSAIKDDAVTTALEKIKTFIPSQKNKVDRSPVIDFSSWNNSGLIKDTISLLQRAVGETRVIQFSYINLRHEQTERSVEPHRLYFRSSAWYLLGWCQTREDFRFFKVSRMSNLTLVAKTFTPRESDGSEEHFMDSWTQAPHTRIRVRVEAPSANRLAEWLPPNQIDLVSGGAVEGVMEFPLDEWVYGYLMSFGEHLTILEPEYIRFEIARRAKKMWENNQS